MNNNHPKTDIRHWRKKVVFQTPASRTYSVQLQHARRRAYVNLGTANKEEAAGLARDFYLDLRANGWEAALAHHKGAPLEKSVNVTVGEYPRSGGHKEPLFAQDAPELRASTAQDHRRHHWSGGPRRA